MNIYINTSKCILPTLRTPSQYPISHPPWLLERRERKAFNSPFRVVLLCHSLKGKIKGFQSQHTFVNLVWNMTNQNSLLLFNAHVYNVTSWTVHISLLLFARKSDCVELNSSFHSLLPLTHVHLSARGVGGRRVLPISTIGQRESTIYMWVVRFIVWNK